MFSNAWRNRFRIASSYIAVLAADLLVIGHYMHSCGAMHE